MPIPSTVQAMTSAATPFAQLATRHPRFACSPDVAADDQDRADLGDRAAKAGQHNGQDSGDLTGAFSFGLVSALASVPRPD